MLAQSKLYSLCLNMVIQEERYSSPSGWQSHFEAEINHFAPLYPNV